MQAVVELAEQLVEQAPVGCSVAVTVFSALPVVRAGGFAVRGGSERPDPSGVGHAVVLDAAVTD